MQFWGFPWKLVWYARGLPWKLGGHFGSRNYFKSNLVCPWTEEIYSLGGKLMYPFIHIGLMSPFIQKERPYVYTKREPICVYQKGATGSPYVYIFWVDFDLLSTTHVTIYTKREPNKDNPSTACVAVCCSVLQCVAVCCNVLQCVAVCCSWSVIQFHSPISM